MKEHSREEHENEAEYVQPLDEEIEPFFNSKIVKVSQERFGIGDESEEVISLGKNCNQSY